MAPATTTQEQEMSIKTESTINLTTVELIEASRLLSRFFDWRKREVLYTDSAVEALQSGAFLYMDSCRAKAHTAHGMVQKLYAQLEENYGVDMQAICEALDKEVAA
jgi:hypothetical protein